MENGTCETRTEECVENKCTEDTCNKPTEEAKKSRGPYSAFQCQPLAGPQLEDMQFISEAFMKLAISLDNDVRSPQDGRYLQMAKRALEDACMYAVKSVSHA